MVEMILTFPESMADYETEGAAGRLLVVRPLLEAI